MSQLMPRWQLALAGFGAIATLASWGLMSRNLTAIAAEPIQASDQTIAPSPAGDVGPAAAIAPSDVHLYNVAELAAPAPIFQPAGGMEQVTSVSQLTDVKPTDWAFQSLQSLVERYGCIVGYPDKTFRGNRAITRYEFAAGLNACMDRINELIGAGTADLVKKEDLESLKKMQEQFASELAALRGRVDALEGRTATLEKQQFSATTKLNGQVWFNLTGAFTGDDVRAERGVAASAFAAPRRGLGGVPTTVLRSEPEVTLGYYLFLNLNTSFTGKDQLVTQLVSGNGNSPANQLVSAGFFNSWGTPFLDQTGVVSPGSVAVRELSYTFPVSKDVRVAIGPRLNWYRYFDGNRFTFYANGAGSFNSSGSPLLNAVDRGSGAAVIWNINKQFRFTAAYLGENTEFLNSANGFNTSSNPADGLFGGTNTLSSELVFSPNKNFNLRLHYTRSNLKVNPNGFVGGTAGEPLPYGFADDGFGGAVNNATADAFMVNFDWLITKGFGIFGRYTYGSTNIDPVSPLRSGGSVDAQAFQFGLGFPDLGKKGALGVLSFGIPHDFISGRRFLLSGGGDGATQFEVEASYFYPINNNLALVPAVYAIFNPNSFGSNPDVYVANLRAQFSF
jgi:Carbohydrate-selective porin, OprB family/S-layer homology domain